MASTNLTQKISDFLFWTRSRPRQSANTALLGSWHLKNKIRCRLTQVAARPYSRSPVLLLDTEDELCCFSKGTSWSVHKSAADKKPPHWAEVRQPRPTSFLSWSVLDNSCKGWPESWGSGIPTLTTPQCIKVKQKSALCVFTRSPRWRLACAWPQVSLESPLRGWHGLGYPHRCRNSGPNLLKDLLSNNRVSRLQGQCTSHYSTLPAGVYLWW